jgi:hypothetical protein
MMLEACGGAAPETYGSRRHRREAKKIPIRWAFHVDLSYASTTERFLTKVEDFVLNTLNSVERDETEQGQSVFE